MKTADSQESSGKSKPKAKLSPELAEVLHMLKSLETEQVGKITPAR